jgi:hypothetical protein
MNPGMAEIGFGNSATHKKPAAPWGQQRAFYLFPEDLEQSGDVLAAATPLLYSPMQASRFNVRFAFAGSTGRRNTGVKSLCWCFKLQGLTWSFI